MRRHRRCPRCGSERSLPIVHGLPTKALEEEAARGRVVLGGCAVDGAEPTRLCRACGHAWRSDGGDAEEAAAEPDEATGEADAAGSEVVPADEPARYELEVDARALRQALSLFDHWLVELQWDARAVLWLEGVHLVVRFGDVEARIPARGLWPGMVAAQAALVVSIREEIEGGCAPRFRLAVEGDRLWLGPRLRIRCTRLPAAAGLPRYIELPERPRLLECILLGARHPAEALRYSGIERLVTVARETLDDVLERLEGILSEALYADDTPPEEVAEAIRHLVRRGLEREER